MRKLTVSLFFLLTACLTACSPTASTPAPVALVASVDSVSASASASLEIPRSEVITSAAPAPVSAPVAPAPVAAKPVPVAPVQAPVVAPAPVVPAPAPVAPEVRCEEDMPCWDCETMGNKICGSMLPEPAYACFMDAMAYLPTTGECVTSSFWSVTPGLILPY